MEQQPWKHAQAISGYPLSILSFIFPTTGQQISLIPPVFLSMMWIWLLILQHIKKKSRNTMTFKITHVSVKHSHVKWHSPSLLSKMLLVPASDSPDFQLEEMAFCLLCLLWWSSISEQISPFSKEIFRDQDNTYFHLESWGSFYLSQLSFSEEDSTDSQKRKH